MKAKGKHIVLLKTLVKILSERIEGFQGAYNESPMMPRGNLSDICTHVVTVFHSVLNQTEFQLVQNRKENCHHDHIPFNSKGNGNQFSRVYIKIPDPIIRRIKLINQLIDFDS